MGKGFRLYIGSALGKGFYLNTKGQRNRHDKAAVTFDFLSNLLDYLQQQYTKRHATLVRIDDKIKIDDKEKILNCIKKLPKIVIPEDLEGKTEE